MVGDGFCDDAADFAQVKERRVFGAVSKSSRGHDDGVFKGEPFGDFCREIQLFGRVGHLIQGIPFRAVTASPIYYFFIVSSSRKKRKIRRVEQ